MAQFFRVKCPECGKAGVLYSSDYDATVHAAFGPEFICKRCRSVWAVRLRKIRKIPEVPIAKIDVDAHARLARKGDPFTSHQAASEMLPYVGKLQKEVLRMVEENPRKTVKELAKIYDCEDNRHIGRRISELKELGHIFVWSTRPCSVSHKLAATYEVTHKKE